MPAKKTKRSKGITGKQRSARRKNMANARKYRWKKGRKKKSKRKSATKRLAKKRARARK